MWENLTLDGRFSQIGLICFIYNMDYLKYVLYRQFHFYKQSQTQLLDCNMSAMAN